ncbi:hypothetical protein ACWDTG_06715 [Rhodococcus zopfii]
MSTFADPNKAYVWYDGDAFRGAADATMPTDPFAATLAGLQAFGGIKAGFESTPEQNTTPLDVWNRRNAPYKLKRDPRRDKMKFRAVDYSPATVLTILNGGTITETSVGSGIYEWDEGDEEEFSILLRVTDATGSLALWTPRATLASPPPRSWNDSDLDGFDFDILALTPFKTLSTFNPLVTSSTSTVTIGGSPTGGTFTLTVGGQTTAGIAYNAAASAVQSALEALSTVGAGKATVTGSAGGPYIVVLSDGGIITASGSGLTPSGTVTVS